MKYVILELGVPRQISFDDLRAAHPNISFPSPAPDALLATYDVYPLDDGPVPAHDPDTEVVESAGIAMVSGNWTRQWTKRALTQAELDARIAELADEVLANRGALKALALTVLDEINTLRAQASLPARTVAQLRAAVEGHSNA